MNVYDYQGIINDANGLTKNKLQLQNKIFTSKRLTVKPDYMETIKDYFHSSAQVINFAKSQIAANIINSWVAKSTNNLIGNIVTPDELDDKTDLILGNTVYFNGHSILIVVPQKKVFTMYQQGTYQYGELLDFDAKFFAIPFENEELSMLIIFPNKIDGLAQVEKKLKGLDLSKILNQTNSHDLRIHVPKLKVESDLGLEFILFENEHSLCPNYYCTQLGLTDAFTERANFSGIANVDLHINKVFQKALIEVNERGTTAAEAGAIGRKYLKVILHNYFSSLGASTNPNIPQIIILQILDKTDKNISLKENLNHFTILKNNKILLLLQDWYRKADPFGIQKP
ncbi:alaserpin-like [Xylocopa sonorina]|uniref:alaserpin-like n=1 Tax=Xylocopa sonorina TaxID=1818115 RepID=UPI00403B0D75